MSEYIFIPNDPDGFTDWLEENELGPIERWTAGELLQLRVQWAETLDPEEQDEQH